MSGLPVGFGDKRVVAAILAPLFVLAIAFGTASSAFASQVGVAAIAQDSEWPSASDVSNAVVTIAPGSSYTGEPITPSVTVALNGHALSADVDYNASFTGNVNAGVAVVTIEGIGSFTGRTTENFEIARADITKISATADSKTYSGKAIKPAVKATFNGKGLQRGVDYSVKYSSNIKVGTAKATIKGQGNFAGEKSISFKIRKAAASKFKVVKIKKQKYTGKALKPEPRVKFAGKKLKKGRDYTLAYKANVNAGTAKVVIKGKGNFEGKKTVVFKIYRPANRSSQSGGSSISSGIPSTPSGSGVVYWTPSGGVYHYSRDCPTLSRSRTVYSGSISESGKSRSCNVCS